MGAELLAESSARWWGDLVAPHCLALRNSLKLMAMLSLSLGMRSSSIMAGL